MAAADLAGTLLVRAGLVSSTQLAAANERRRAATCTLVEALVADGAIKEDAVCDFFAQRLLVPRVGWPELQKVGKKVVDLVPRELAHEFFAVPVSLDGERNLLVAMADPADTRAVDEFAFFTGAYVMRAVAPASMIAWALYHYYQLESPLLPRAVSARSSAEAKAVSPSTATLVADEFPAHRPPPAAPPLPAPPVDSGRVAAPEPVILLDGARKKSTSMPAVDAPPALTAAAAVRPAVLGGSPKVIVDQAALSAPAGKARRRASVVEDVFGEDTPLPAPMPLGVTGPVKLDTIDLVPALKKRRRTTTMAGVGAAGTAGPDAAPRKTAPPPLTPEAALGAVRRALDGATSRDAVIDGLVDYLGAHFRRAAFFALRKELLCGWRAVGATIDATAFRHVALPLTSVPTLADAVETRLPRIGPLDDQSTATLAGPLGGAPTDALLVPLALRERAIGVAFADGAAMGFSPAHLVEVTHAAARALERVISAKKAPDQP